MKKRVYILLLSLLLGLVACGGQDEVALETATPEPRILRVMTHDAFAVSEAVVEAFEAQFAGIL